jgi:hypothetical protein
MRAFLGIYGIAWNFAVKDLVGNIKGEIFSKIIDRRFGEVPEVPFCKYISILLFLEYVLVNY